MRNLALIHSAAVGKSEAVREDVDTVDVRLGPDWIDPVDPLENLDRYRAQSLLAGLFYRDKSRNPGPLPLDQARDVLRWATARIL